MWVFSTTLLQLNTDDRFRGRVFSADLGLCMLTIAVGAYVCGGFLDSGISARTLVTATGVRHADSSCALGLGNESVEATESSRSSPLWSE